MDISELYQIYQAHPVITTDSRDCPEGSIFLALKGASFDGNKFADMALEKGCAYVIVDEKEYAKEGDKLIDDYVNGEIGEIYLAYTSFKNTVVHVPKLIKLLPVDAEAVKEDSDADSTPMNYEPNDEEALNLIIPKYVCSLVYGALIEAVASENGARMQAMDNATSNAEEMIEDLSLKFNRARQASITQELTEIISGANAIE